MVRYFYAWTPLLIVGAVSILALPWLGLIALMIVALVVVPGLAWAIIFVPYRAGQAISHRWEGQSDANRRAAAAPRATAVHSSYEGATR